MKKKYVVYCIESYFDDYGFLHFNKHNAGEYNDEEDAIIRSYMIRNLGYMLKLWKNERKIKCLEKLCA